MGIHLRATYTCVMYAITQRIIFFHPDYTVGPGISPDHAFRLAGFTAGRELHPALKISCSIVKNYSRMNTVCQEKNFTYLDSLSKTIYHITNKKFRKERAL